MKKQLFIIISAILFLFLAFAPQGQATLISWDFDEEISGAVAPEGLSPWLNVTFDDGDTPGSVTLTFEDVGLTDAEFVRKLLFNFDPTLDVTALSITQISGPTASISTGENTFKADGDGYFDIEFDFSANHFEVGDTAVFNLTFTNIIADSFNYLSESGGGAGTYVSAAHVQGIGPTDGDSGWVAPSGAAPIPEPATMLILGTGLLGLAGVGRKKLMGRG